MKSKEQEPPSWKYLLYDFTQDTTLHGVRYITRDTRYWLRRVFWLLLVVGVFALFSFILVERCVDYFNYPSAVNVEILYPSSLPFPAVTICNQNFLRASVVHEHGLYDSIRHQFSPANSSTSHTNDGECEDSFRLARNYHLPSAKNSNNTFTSITPDVCQHLCLKISDMNCNGFVYEHTTKTCYITSELDASREDKLVYKQNVDFYQRRRCEGPEDIKCGFDAHLCSFTQDTSDETDWVRASGKTPKPLTGPTQDHTTGTGSYLYIDASAGSRARLISEYISSSEQTQRCVEFYYYMYGAEITTLNVYVRSTNNQETLLWRRNGDQGPKWRRGFVKINVEYFQVIFESIASQGKRDNIALDDIRIAKCSLFEKNCLVWKTGTEYVGSISKTKSGKKCLPWLDIFRKQALNPYKFPDSCIGSAENYCRNPGGDKDQPWCYYGLQEHEWEYCDIPFCTCGDHQRRCANDLCVNVNLLCDGNNDCGDWSDEEINCSDYGSFSSIQCDFKDGFRCGYSIGTEDGDFSWLRNEGRTPSLDTGPTVDRTNFSPNGGYMYVEATFGKKDSVTTLTSPPEWLTYPACLVFHYHMYGQHIGMLNVSLMMGSQEEQIFYKDGDHTDDDEWRQVQINLNHSMTSEPQKTRIIFKAIRGNGYTGDISLDDIYLYHRPCHLPACAQSQFNCQNGRCVDMNQLCDGVDDCLDNSDETRPCAQLICDFDGNNLCGYTLDGSNKLQWRHEIGSASTKRHQPKVDASKNSPEGKYLYVTGSDVDRIGIKTYVKSPWAKANGTQCLSFAYYLTGNSAGLLAVKQTFLNKTTVLLDNLYWEHGEMWNRAGYTIHESDGEFYITFETVSSLYGSDVGLDDVRVDNGPCQVTGESINCTFEDYNICGYRQIFYDSFFLWVRIKADRRNLLPDFDITTGTSAGYTLSVNSLSVNKDRNGYIHSPYEFLDQEHCLRFHYWMRGPQFGTLRVSIQSPDGFVRQLFRRSGSLQKRWYDTQVNVPPGKWRLLLHAVRGYERYTPATIDEVSLSPGACPSSCSANEFTCSNGLCIPSSHVCDGWDDCMDFSDEKCDIDRDCLRSRGGQEYVGDVNVTESDVPCVPWSDVIFDYTGKTPFLFPDTDLQSAENYCRNPTRADRPWCYTNLNGERDYCDIPSCECSANQFTCPSGGCVPNTKLCDSNKDCMKGEDETIPCNISVSCDFDDPFICGYRIVENGDKFQWLRWNGGTYSSYTGPSRDHTQGNDNGYYLVTEATGMSAGEIARVYSPEVSILSVHCFSFYYALYGRDIEKLTIYKHLGNNFVTTLDIRKWSQGRVWRQLSFNIPPGNYSLIFQAVKGPLYRSDYAIDDVSFTEGPCADLESCPGDSYQCSNGKCVSQDDICDGINHCGDGSDESLACGHNCIREDLGEFYMGKHSYSETGRQCKRWVDANFTAILEELAIPPYIGLLEFPDETLESAGRGCRNPDRKPRGLWCFVEGGGPHDWEFCDIPLCAGLNRCEQNELECHNRKCVSRDVECNGIDDCGDNSDEGDVCDGTRHLAPVTECRATSRGTDYIGTMNVTVSGSLCLPWSYYNLQYNFTDDSFPDGSVSAAGSSCRNPTGSPRGPWCFTEKNGKVVNESCSIPPCECKETPTGSNYVGTMSVTSNGLTCQRWDSQSPHTHARNVTSKFPEDNITETHNFCRNPDNEPLGPWCFTTDPSIRWTYCDIPLCGFLSTSTCKVTRDGSEYSGKTNTTDSGHTCGRWDKDRSINYKDGAFPGGSTSGAENYCRNPMDRMAEGPWCFTERSELYRRFCNIPYCEGSDQLRSVNCSFDSAYACGYTLGDGNGRTWVRKGIHFLKSQPGLNKLLKKNIDVCYYSETRGADYLGLETFTQSGKVCQRWDSFMTTVHSYTDDRMYPDGSRANASNYCRNPTSVERTPWCFPLDNSGGNTEKCAIKACRESILVDYPDDSNYEPAVLLSPLTRLEGPVHCLRFQYMMYGDSAGTVAVFIENETKKRAPLWETYGGSRDYKWNTTEVEIRDIHYPFRLVFLSYQGYGDIATAIDAVSLSPGKCSYFLGMEQNQYGGYTCKADQITCKSGTNCVPLARVCDGIDDCGDNSDETEYNCDCKEDQYKCANGRCISRLLLLDGQDDCTDNSDETNFIPTECPEDPALVTNQKGYGNSARGRIQWLDGNYTSYDVLSTGSEFTDFLREASHNRQDLIHRAWWQGEVVSSNNFTELITDYGVCYQYISPERDVFSTGSRKGLKMILNVERYEEMEGPHDEVGVKMYLHSPGKLPMVKDLGFSLAPGQNFLVDVKMTQVTSMRPKVGECGEVDLTHFDEYDGHRCIRECEVIVTLDTCKCLAPHMPDRGNDTYGPCNFEDYFKCILGNETDIDNKVVKGVRCPQCKKPCHLTTYDPVISYGDLSSTLINEILNPAGQLQKEFYEAVDVQDHVRPSYVDDLQVFFNISTTYKLIEQVVKKHIGEREGSSLLKIKQALEQYRLDYDVDYGLIKDRIQQLEIEYSAKIGHIIEFLKEGIESLRFLSHKFKHLAEYSNKSEEALLISKNRVAEEIYLVNASFNEYMVKRIEFEGSYSDDSFTNDNNLLPCTLYVSQEKKIFCESKFTEFYSIMKNMISLENVTKLSEADVETMKEWSQQLILISRDVENCFGDYFTIVSESVEVLKTINPELYHSMVTDSTIHQAKPGELRTIYAPLYQDQRMIEETIKSYTRGFFTKEKMVSQLSGNMMTEVIGRIERYFAKLEFQWFDKFDQLLEKAQDHFIHNYKVLLYQAGNVTQFFHNKSNPFEMDTMKLWSRNLVSLDNNNIEIKETNSWDLIIPDIGTVATVIEYIQKNAGSLVAEHVQSYFEDIIRTMELFKEEMWSFKSQLTLSVQEVNSLLRKYTAEMELGANFIMNNFLMVSIYFSQLSLDSITEYPAYEWEALFGDIGGYMGLLLGGSILTVFELLDLLVYNTAWKAGHRVSHANKLGTPREEPVVVNGKEPSSYRDQDVGQNGGNVI